MKTIQPSWLNKTTSLRAGFCMILLVVFSCQNNENIGPNGNGTPDQELTIGMDDLVFEARSFNKLCGLAKIDSTKNSYHVYLDKTLCANNVKLNGEVVITLVKGNDWKEQNAEIEISYINYSIENDRRTHQDSLKKFYVRRTINGTERVINLSGKTIEDFWAGKTNSIKRKMIANNVRIQYDDNTAAIQYYKSASREVVRNKEGVVQMISRGDTIINNYNNIDEWGVDEKNRAFYNVMEEPLTRSLCYENVWKITSGKRVRYGFNYIRQNIYGVNTNGEEDSSCRAYGFKVIYENTANHKGDTTIVYKY